MCASITRVKRKPPQHFDPLAGYRVIPPGIRVARTVVKYENVLGYSGSGSFSRNPTASARPNRVRLTVFDGRRHPFTRRNAVRVRITRKRSVRGTYVYDARGLSARLPTLSPAVVRTVDYADKILRAAKTVVGSKTNRHDIRRTHHGIRTAKFGIKFDVTCAYTYDDGDVILHILRSRATSSFIRPSALYKTAPFYIRLSFGRREIRSPTERRSFVRI